MKAFMKFLKDLEDSQRKQKEYYDRCKADFVQYRSIFKTTLASNESSEAQKVKASLGILLETDKLERLSFELINLHNMIILTCHVGMSKITVDNIHKQLTKSGILEKAKDIGDVAKLKEDMNKAIKLLEKYYEEKKKVQEEIEKSRQNNLPFYVS